jgi:HAMP domain-containing protein
MFQWVRKSITAQFIVPMITLIVIVAVAGATIGVSRQWNNGVAALREQADVLAVVAAGGLAGPLSNLDYSSVAAQLRPLSRDPVFMGATVVDAKGVQRAAEGSMPPAESDDALTISSKIVKNGAAIGEVKIAMSLARVQREMQEFAIWAIGIAAGVSLALAAILVALTYRVSSPISDLISTMDELASGRLDTRVPALHRADEIGHMASSVEVFRRTLAEAQELRAARGRRLRASTPTLSLRNYTRGRGSLKRLQKRKSRA